MRVRVYDSEQRKGKHKKIQTYPGEIFGVAPGLEVSVHGLVIATGAISVEFR